LALEPNLQAESLVTVPPLLERTHENQVSTRDRIAKTGRAGLPEPYEVVDDLSAIPKELRGKHARNPVNLPRGQGVQLELPPTIRWNHREKGWSDHQGVSRAPHVERLIDALSAGVAAWPQGDGVESRPAVGG
jgi:hypothetical protein